MAPYVVQSFVLLFKIAAHQRATISHWKSFLWIRPYSHEYVRSHSHVSNKCNAETTYAVAYPYADKLLDLKIGVDSHRKMSHSF